MTEGSCAAPSFAPVRPADDRTSALAETRRQIERVEAQRAIVLARQEGIKPRKNAFDHEMMHLDEDLAAARAEGFSPDVLAQVREEKATKLRAKYAAVLTISDALQAQAQELESQLEKLWARQERLLVTHPLRHTDESGEPAAGPSDAELAAIEAEDGPDAEEPPPARLPRPIPRRMWAIGDDVTLPPGRDGRGASHWQEPPSVAPMEGQIATVDELEQLGKGSRVYALVTEENLGSLQDFSAEEIRPGMLIPFRVTSSAWDGIPAIQANGMSLVMATSRDGALWRRSDRILLHIRLFRHKLTPKEILRLTNPVLAQVQEDAPSSPGIDIVNEAA